MKFGLLNELQVPKPWTPRQEFDIHHQAIDQSVLAEQQGFDYSWIVEHHFLEEFAHSSGHGWPTGPHGGETVHPRH